MNILRSIQVFVISCAIAIGLLAISPDAIALTQVKLFDLSAGECPPELAEGMVDSGSVSAANCFLITGKAENTSGKLVLNADIYGRIYDADNNIVLPNRNRLGAIEEVPPGISEFQFRISVPVNQRPPLQLEQFKAAGFVGKVRRWLKHLAVLIADLWNDKNANSLSVGIFNWLVHCHRQMWR
jgi:hypothetical protein